MNQAWFAMQVILAWTIFKYLLHKIYWGWLELTGRAMTIKTGTYKVHIRVSDSLKLYELQRQVKDSLKPKED